MNNRITSQTLWRHLIRDARRDWVGFHMPGHGRGRGFPRSFRRRMAQMDITEVAGMDDLSHPQGVLYRAQERLAALMGSARSFFLVNGSSSGILAMLGALCRPGDSLIVPRASHRAVYHGLVLGDIRPEYLYTQWRDKRPILPSPQDVLDILERHPGVAGMVLTSPDYWGRCADVAGIAEILHRRGKALLLDQAHGAHFGFCDALPPHGGQCGADAWVQSAHKTLPALTQSAWLHINRTERLSMTRMAQKIRLLQTTSPSYPLMAGLDYARSWLEGQGQSAYDKLLDRINTAVRAIEGATPVRRVDFSRERGVAHTDPTRLTLDTAGLDMDAKAVEECLLKRGIRIEWAEGNSLVLICTPWHRERDFVRLARALRGIPIQEEASRRMDPPPLPEPQTVLPMGQALDSAAAMIEYREAVDRVAADFVIPYPPGIPLLCPGERITADHIAWIGYGMEQGTAPAGVDSGRIAVIQ